MSKTLKVGDKASRSKIFTENDVKQFAEVSTDKNPIHLDENYAQNTIFKQRIVHGMLVGSLFSGILGCDLPGEGTIYLGQTLSFKAPVPLNEKDSHGRGNQYTSGQAYRYVQDNLRGQQGQGGYRGRGYCQGSLVKEVHDASCR